MKLGSKIFCLVVLLILLTGIVALVGYRGLSGVAERVAKTDAVNSLVENLSKIRQQEKNYIILGDRTHADDVRKTVSQLKEITGLAKNKFDQQKSKEQIERVAGQLLTYERAFAAYDDLEGRKNETMATMEENARKAMAKLEEIKADQEGQLVKTREEMEGFLKETLAIVDDANLVIKQALEARIAEKDYLLAEERKAYERSIDTINVIFDITDRMLPRLTEEADKELVQKMGDQSAGYVMAFSNYTIEKTGLALKRMYQYTLDMQTTASAIRDRQKERLAAVQVKTSTRTEDKLKKANDANRMIKWFLDTRKNEKEVIISKDEKYRDMVNKQITQILNLGQDLKTRFTTETNIQRMDEAVSLIQAYKEAFDRFAGLMTRQGDADRKMVSAARLAQDTCAETQREQKQKMFRQIANANGLMIGGATISMFFGLLFGYVITRSIKRGITPVIESLTAGTDQVAVGSGEVAIASQTLADGASRQAAGVEEISSSMEEMSAMTKQNADNAGNADTLMKAANKVVAQADASMNQLITAMEEISSASEETSKIIKTIDEIAFQTNLLALNAAVEAARAGEAGAGFAVVADEVRNLAMRAADAAKNTANLIETTVEKVGGGFELVTRTNDAFAQVAESVKKVSGLVGEIAGASTDQADGIEQVNKAVTEVDRVTQQNAANAEESASAAEEMNAQVEQMKLAVSELMAVVGRAKKGNVRRSTSSEPSVTQLPHAPHPELPAPE